MSNLFIVSKWQLNGPCSFLNCQNCNTVLFVSLLNICAYFKTEMKRVHIYHASQKFDSLCVCVCACVVSDIYNFMTQLLNCCTFYYSNIYFILMIYILENYTLLSRTCKTWKGMIKSRTWIIAFTANYLFFCMVTITIHTLYQWQTILQPIAAHFVMFWILRTLSNKTKQNTWLP